MKKIRMYASLMRLPNVVVIILTMFLLRYGILKPFLFSVSPEMMSSWLDFSLLVLATVLVTVGGYIINDIFDSGIDAINKPGINRIGTELKPLQATFLYRILNGIALLISVYLAFRIKSLTFFLVFPFVIYLLWLYSARYKRMLIWGNLIVAFLSALVIFLVWYFEFLSMMKKPEFFAGILPEISNVSFFFIIYLAFAFLVSLFREIIKDMEDRKGDEEFGARTLVVAYGEKVARTVVTALIAITFLMVIYYQFILMNRGWTSVFWYFAIVVQFPLLYLVYMLFRAKKPSDFHFLSNICRLIMFAGILSIQLIYTSL